jgi:hypothetical protein
MTGKKKLYSLLIIFIFILLISSYAFIHINRENAACYYGGSRTSISENLEVSLNNSEINQNWNYSHTTIIIEFRFEPNKTILWNYSFLKSNFVSNLTILIFRPFNNNEIIIFPEKEWISFSISLTIVSDIPYLLTKKLFNGNNSASGSLQFSKEKEHVQFDVDENNKDIQIKYSNNASVFVSNNECKFKIDFINIHACP